VSASTAGTIAIVGFLVLAAVCLSVAIRLPRSRQVLTMAFLLGFTTFGVVALLSLIFFARDRAY